MKQSKYGDIPRKVAKAIAGRWHKGELEGSGWPDCESWVKWAYANGYQKGFRLGKFDDHKPHGPDNSFFYHFVNDLPESEKNAMCKICRECNNDCPSHGGGCTAWREWFVKNWDDNICSKPKKVPKAEPGEKRQFFRYEHPDLERERIV